MTSLWYDRMLWATVTGTLTTFAVLGLCRWRGASPVAKVWLCRLACLKWPLSLAFVAGPTIAVSPWNPTVAASSNTGIPVMVLSVFTVWFMGLALSLLECGKAWNRARQVFRQAHVVKKPMSKTFGRLKRALNVEEETVCRVHESSEAFAISLPGTGIVVPVEASEFVIAHELAHVKNKDLAWSGAGSLAQALFWFLPWVHALHRELRLWQDVAADRTALSLTSTPKSQAVGEILAAVSSTVVAPALGLGPEAETCSRRFKELFEYRGRMAFTVVAACLGVLLLCPVTVWSDQKPAEFRGRVASATIVPVATRSDTSAIYTMANP